LASIAYNAGENVSDWIVKNYGHNPDWSSIKGQLPIETRKFVPTIQAIEQVINAGSYTH